MQEPSNSTGAEYLRGQATTDECEPLFKDYKKCLTVCKPVAGCECIFKVRQVALQDRGIDKMLEEAREDHRENDAVHMRRKCESSLSDLVKDGWLICVEHSRKWICTRSFAVLCR